MAPSKKLHSRGEKNNKSAPDSNNINANTRNSGPLRDSLYDNGEHNPTSTTNNDSVIRDPASHLIESEVSASDSESGHEKSSQNSSDSDIYGDLGKDEDGEFESDGNPVNNIFESDITKNDFYIEQKDKNPIIDEPAVASKKLEDQINAKLKDNQSDSKIKKKSSQKRKSNKDELSVQANMDLLMT
ncbi:unnamed protein product [Meganyctiphanes norvegica]|uniref:Uncharacterized protein n=1 Tax=Meganyctiphanes norvegica TaxID=48144 RepID=A0AAV2QMS6_MEGNR